MSYVRKQCCECGSLHPLSHTGPCTSCYKDSWRYWCTRHNATLAEPICPQCATEERRRKVLPLGRPVSLIVGYQGQRWQFAAGPVVVGRGEDCDLQINSPVVSHHHCEFFLDGVDWAVRDTESTNGTFVDEEVADREGVIIDEGTRIQLGGLSDSPVLVVRLPLRPRVQAPVRPAAREAPPPRAPAIGTDGNAGVSLALGILAIIISVFCCLGLPLGILAVVLANRSLKGIRDGRLSPHSAGRAKAGLICGCVGIVLSILTFVVSVILQVMKDGNQGGTP